MISRTTLGKLLGLAGALVAAACSDSAATDRLSGSETADTSNQSLYEHKEQATSQQTTDTRKKEVEAVGSPEVYARLHSCGKMTVHSLGRLLTTRGLSTSSAAYQLYEGGRVALGEANYGARSSEVILASTANLTKQFDVLVAAAPDLLANVGSPEGACPGVSLFSEGEFTKDGLACLMGKPARPEHVFLANQAVKDGVAQGVPEADAKAIAIATLLQAAHTCE